MSMAVLVGMAMGMPVAVRVGADVIGAMAARIVPAGEGSGEILAHDVGRRQAGGAHHDLHAALFEQLARTHAHAADDRDGRRI